VLTEVCLSISFQSLSSEPRSHLIEPGASEGSKESTPSSSSLFTRMSWDSLSSCKKAPEMGTRHPYSQFTL